MKIESVDPDKKLHDPIYPVEDQYEGMRLVLSQSRTMLDKGGSRPSFFHSLDPPESPQRGRPLNPSVFANPSDVSFRLPMIPAGSMDT